MAIEEAEESENDDEEEILLEPKKIIEELSCSRSIVHKVQWVEETVYLHGSRTYYCEAIVGGCWKVLFVVS